MVEVQVQVQGEAGSNRGRIVDKGQLVRGLGVGQRIEIALLADANLSIISGFTSMI
jgi:hypothetical protein